VDEPRSPGDMEVTALVVAMPCVTFLVAFRWWLDSRPKASAHDAALVERLERLETWRTHTEMGKLR